MADKLGMGNNVHELKLGNSFEPGGQVAFHSMRYDFKPASVDVTKVASVDVGENHSVTVTVPHVESSGTSHTVYKGNKRPCQKECVLIIDHQTGEITLEKLTNNIQLKKTRIEGSSKAALSRPLTPSEQLKYAKEMKTSPSHKKKKKSQQPPPSQPKESPQARRDPSPSVAVMSESSSDSDSDEEPTPKAKTNMSSSSTSHQSSHASARFMSSTLSEDLQLSESGSDSD